jgi:putative hydrolase of the HAD superfamily
MSIRAVIFDLGGVVLASPIETFREWEREKGLGEGFLGRVVVGSGSDGAWSRLERGELNLAEFCDAFDAEIAAAGGNISSAELMMEVARRGHVRPVMLEAIRDLRKRGLKVAALTNNWAWSADVDSYEMLRAEFDAFIESFKVGLRKPDPRIYELACNELDVTPHEAVFLDDIGMNLKSARALGMTTIKVIDPESALAELARVLEQAAGGESV